MNNIPDITVYTDALSPDMLSSARKMAEQLDLSSVEGILSIGSEAVSHINQVSTELVDVALTTDLDSAMGEITRIAKHVTRFGRMLHGGRALSKPRSKDRIKERYDVLKIELTRVAANLDRDRRNLIRSVSLLEETHCLNLRIFQELSVSVEAGRFRQAQLAKQADADPDLLHRLEIKLSDLETSRVVCRQTATQIFLLRDSAISLLDRINSINDTVIPLWTTQVALALGISTISEGRMSATGAYAAITEATKCLTDEIATTGQCITQAHHAVGDIKA